MIRRSRLEIYIDVLKAIDDNRKKPTHVMYRANLNWERLEKYLESLAGQDLVMKTDFNGRMTFSLTPKGRDVLGYFRKLEDQIHSKQKVPLPEVYVR